MTKQSPSRHAAFIPLAAAVAGLCALAACYLWFLGGVAPVRQLPIGGRFQLTTATGETVTDRNYRGRTLLIYFGYTHCRDICPTTLAAIGQALDTLGSRAANVQPIFVTVDPQRDTPAVLHSYLASFSPRITGLTGTKAQLRAMQHAYRIQSIPHGPASGDSDADIDHSSVLLVVAPNGQYQAAIAPGAPAQIATDLAALL